LRGRVDRVYVHRVSEINFSNSVWCFYESIRDAPSRSTQVWLAGEMLESLKTVVGQKLNSVSSVDTLLPYSPNDVGVSGSSFDPLGGWSKLGGGKAGGCGFHPFVGGSVGSYVVEAPLGIAEGSYAFDCIRLAICC